MENYLIKLVYIFEYLNSFTSLLETLSIRFSRNKTNVTTSLTLWVFLIKDTPLLLRLVLYHSALSWQMTEKYQHFQQKYSFNCRFE